MKKEEGAENAVLTAVKNPATVYSGTNEAVYSTSVARKQSAVREISHSDGPGPDQEALESWLEAWTFK